jgi:hypothetical protein
MKELKWHRNRDRTNGMRLCAYGERGIYSIATVEGVVRLTVFTYGIKRVAQAPVSTATIGKAVALKLDAAGPRFSERSRVDASIRRHAAAEVAL